VEQLGLDNIDSPALVWRIPEWFMPNLEEVVFQAPVPEEVSL
jgi:hypothetical protein